MSSIESWKDEAALQRHEIIAPLLDASLDAPKRSELRTKLALSHNLSVRSIFRYEKAYEQGGFTALKPKSRDLKPSPNLPENFNELLNEAILLKREVPSRSVNQIILILELEGKVLPGVLKRSTLQRYLFNSGFGKKQMKKYAEARHTSAGRFAKPHRMMMLQADIKYGLKLPIGKNGQKVQTYLSTAIDDHSRFVVSSGFYDNQETAIVEDTLRKAFLSFGKPDCLYVDNGKQYVSKWLVKACAKLGIRLLHCKPYVAKSKGKVEVFNRFVDSFLTEATAAKVQTLEEMNRLWDIWLNAYYHEKPHEALAEGVSPLMEWNRDSRLLTFLDVDVVAQAFLHHESRKVDKSGCISFGSRKYEVGLSLIGASVDVTYDPMSLDTLTVAYQGSEPFSVKPLEIGEYCRKGPKLPDHMLPLEPQTSRLLDALESKYTKKKELETTAIRFGSYKKGGKCDV
jgi:putative transposase